MGSFESDTWELECQLAGSGAVEPQASHLPSLGFKFLICKVDIIVVTISWVARKMAEKIFWCLMHRRSQ